MSISGISSNTSFFQQTNTNPSQQWQHVLQGREDFALLAQALESGDLVSAQQAFADLQSLRQGLISSEIPIQGDFAALGKALASNDLFQAQTDLAQIRSDVRSALQNQSGPAAAAIRGHHRHHSSSANNSDAFSGETSSEVGKTLNVTA